MLKKVEIYRCDSSVMKKIEERAVEYGREQQGTVDIEVFEAGYRQALLDIKHELNLCAANAYKFPVLHVYKFIDEQLKEKRDEQD